MPNRTSCPVIVHHMAALDESPFPPNSLEAVSACLQANAAFIEIDVMPLRAEDYLLVHDPVLENETTGSGPVDSIMPDDAVNLFIKHRGAAAPYRPALLSQIVRLLLDLSLIHISEPTRH